MSFQLFFVYRVTWLVFDKIFINHMNYSQVNICDDYSLPVDFVKKRPSSLEQCRDVKFADDFPSPSIFAEQVCYLHLFPPNNLLNLKIICFIQIDCCSCSLIACNYIKSYLYLCLFSFNS